jgi:hypothetical protein
MSGADILNELAKLTRAERAEIARRIAAMDAGAIDLESRGIDAEVAAELRARLEPFAIDWNSSEMDAYDRYDAAKADM